MRRVALLVLVAAALGACGRGAPAPAVAAIERPLPELVRLALGARFSCFIDGERTVRCWGDVPGESSGRAPEDRLRGPHAIPRMTEVHEIAAAPETFCARTSERRVLCWGAGVHGEGEREHPVEVGSLRGATSIAVAGARVCGLVADRLECAAENERRVREAVAPGAWLEAVGETICVLDGRGPARCLAERGATLWPVSGSDGAVSLALARGVCATTAAGVLACDGEAREATEASLRPVEGVRDARVVRGGPHVRCVARAEATECTGEGDEVTTIPGAATSLGVGVEVATRREDAWHACVAVERRVVCAGRDASGEVSGRGRPAVERLIDRPGARDLELGLETAWLVTDRGTLLAVPLARPDRAVEDTQLTGWLDLGPCQYDAPCGRLEGDRLALTGAEPRVVSGFAATGAPFPVTLGTVCAPAVDGAVCTDFEGVSVVRGMSQPVSRESELCGLSRGAIVCGDLADPRPRAPLSGAPRDFARLFGGAEQLFAERRDGTWWVMGHNGVGQLGLTPSRPIRTLTTTSARGFTQMAFAYHMSCGWTDTAGVVCAGLDEHLSPRVLAPTLSGVPVDRGDGQWRAIPEVTDVRALASNGRVGCALDVRGTVWCWGGEGGGAGPRVRGPTEIDLALPSAPTP